MKILSTLPQQGSEFPKPITGIEYRSRYFTAYCRTVILSYPDQTALRWPAFDYPFTKVELYAHQTCLIKVFALFFPLGGEIIPCLEQGMAWSFLLSSYEIVYYINTYLVLKIPTYLFCSKRKSVFTSISTYLIYMRSFSN